VHDDAGSLEAFRAGASIGHELGMTAMALELEIAAALVVADVEMSIARSTSCASCSSGPPTCSR
jgi:hypothetical protein